MKKLISNRLQGYLFHLLQKLFFINIFSLGTIHSETGVTGTIKVNGKNRSNNSQSFRSIAAYIHQEDTLRPYLTVGEAMTIATNLKLGYNVTKEYKSSMVWLIMINVPVCK